jgi:(p)ppGpp synthase/HD superfamily hydrolase
MRPTSASYAPALTRADADRAFRYAVRQHDDQRYGPYYQPYHLRHTILALKELGFTDDTHRAVAALHDVLEDTQAPAAELRAQFGEVVTRAVEQLTRVEGVELAVYIGSLDALAFAVKLADRVSNLRTLGKHAGQETKDKQRRWPKYEREMPFLRQRAVQLGPTYVRALQLVAHELEAARRRLLTVG